MSTRNHAAARRDGELQRPAHVHDALAVGDVEGHGLVGGPVGEHPRRQAPGVGALALGEGVPLDAEFERRLEDGDEVLARRGNELVEGWSGGFL
jgi:hypothetical protein